VIVVERYNITQQKKEKEGKKEGREEGTEGGAG